MHSSTFSVSLSFFNSQAYPKWQALFSGFKRMRPSDLAQVVNDRLRRFPPPDRVRGHERCSRRVS